jgi:magnesium chelatase subunit D
MSEPAAPADPLAEAMLAARLLALAPMALGGICLRGGGPARDAVLGALQQWLPEGSSWRRMPAHIDDERLLGGIDIAASLAAGRTVEMAGLLDQARGGVIVAPMAERMRESTAGRLAQAIDGEAAFGLVLLDDGADRDDRPPRALLERIAFDCDLSAVRSLDWQSTAVGAALALDEVGPLADDALAALAATGAALGIASIRPLHFAATATRAHAGLMGRREISTADLEIAARLVLAPRATRLPPDPETAEQASEPEGADRHDPGESTSGADAIPEDVVLAAALASIPPDVLAQIGAGKAGRSARGGGEGKRAKSALRGKPLGARPGLPRGGARLALVDSMRAAVPWQPLRRREAGSAPTPRLLMRKEDLRIRRFEERSRTVTVFCVDASGSAAAARLAEAKGAVELILAQAYVKRSEVALVAFRGECAELLLPPTRSLTRARRALSGLPGGGGTPLASGISMARELGETIAANGPTPFLVFLTDGSANIAADGTPGRGQAREDALAAARAVAARRLDALVIDISPRARPDAERLAAEMGARYLPLPMADARALERVISAAQPEAMPA